MKANIDDEINNINYLEKLNAKLENIISFKLPIENSIRNLVVIKKIGITNCLYPRKYDIIIKKTL